MIKVILQVMCILLIVSMGIWALCDCSPIQLQSEYTVKISVETPDKIENAISNVVSDLEKRDFVPVYLDVKWYPAIKSYKIFARGIDRAKLGKYEP